jgi:hypothetical protein
MPEFALPEPIDLITDDGAMVPVWEAILLGRVEAWPQGVEIGGTFHDATAGDVEQAGLVLLAAAAEIRERNEKGNQS